VAKRLTANGLLSAASLLAGLASLGCAGGPRWSGWPDFKRIDASQSAVVAPRERIEQLRELGKHGHELDPAVQERTAADLARVLNVESDPVMRAEILRAVARFNSPTATAMVVRGLDDAEREVRIAACEALAAGKPPQAAERLAATLTSDVDIDVRLAAAKALGALGDRQGVTALSLALEDPDPALQYQAVLSLSDLTGENLGKDVNAWRAYVQSGQAPPPPSLAERVRGWFVR
jgi:HEAT repeat protein